MIEHEFGKLPPQARDFEEAVLGAIMIEESAIHTVGMLLTEDMFYSEQHIRIFKAIRMLYMADSPIDILTVTKQLIINGDLAHVGGPLYITQLTNKIGSAANIEFHAMTIREKYILREQIALCSNGIKSAYESDADFVEIAESLGKGLDALDASNNLLTTKDIAGSATKVFTNAMSDNPSAPGLKFYNKFDVYGSMQKGDLIIVAGRPGMGKCLTKGTPILLYDGSIKNVEEIIVGDVLMAPDSTPRNVLSLARGREMMYWVRQNGGAIDYRVNESHILSLKCSRNGDYGNKNGDIINICILDYMNLSKKRKSNLKGWKSKVEFPYKKVTIDPYILGLWLGDGAKSAPVIYNPDEEVVSSIETWAKEHGYTINRKWHGGCWTIRISGMFISKLRDIDVLNNKHIPQKYLVNNDNIRLELLAGLLDTDGYHWAGGYEIVQVNGKLAFDIKFLADTLGFKTCIAKKKTSIKSTGFKGEAFVLRINGDVSRIPCKVKRKKASPSVKNKNWLCTGITVVKDVEDDYFGFEIDGDKLFLLGDCTVTHNTSEMVQHALNLSRSGIQGGIISIEMSTEQITTRILANLSQIEESLIGRGNLAIHEKEKLKLAYKTSLSLPIYINDSVRSLMQIKSVARVWKRKHDIQWLMVDHLHQMSGTGIGNEKTIDVVSRNTIGMKALAKSLEIPIILLCQLNRSLESTATKRPELHHLKETGAIEENADKVIFLYRPEYYGISTWPNDCAESGNDCMGQIEKIMAKHRGGPCKTTFENCDMKYYRIWNDYSPDFDPAQQAKRITPKLDEFKTRKNPDGSDCPF